MGKRSSKGRGVWVTRRLLLVLFKKGPTPRKVKAHPVNMGRKVNCVLSSSGIRTVAEEGIKVQSGRGHDLQAKMDDEKGRKRVTGDRPVHCTTPAHRKKKTDTDGDDARGERPIDLTHQKPSLRGRSSSN